MVLVPVREPEAATGLALEKLDHADLNRIVTAFNRASILNRQAAKAAAASAAALAMRFAVDLAARI